MQVSWQAVIGKRYQLDYANDAPLNFAPVQDGSFPRQAGSTVETFTESLIGPEQPPIRFYRVRLAP
jgi:hypothetical protein